MAFESKLRYAKISARKVRPLANMVRGKFVDEALDALRFQPQRGARMLEKTIKAALANAQDPEQNPGQIVDEHRLVVSEACVDGGPMFKRVRPGARGMSLMILKRQSHIRIKLEEV